MKDKGFTLVELLIVIVVVCIFTVSLIGFVRSAKQSIDKSTAPIVKALDQNKNVLEKLE
jgi:prepilin-type N-terminal cleavage/methylation domain-containing protein